MKELIHKAFLKAAHSLEPEKNLDVPIDLDVENLSDYPTPAFAVGIGRSGTHFLQELIGEDHDFLSHHIELLDADSFAQYCIWNDLPVDLEGFLYTRAGWITQAGNSGKRYFESNPYLALSIRQLYQRFGARFVHIARRPEDVVNSHYIKGWYAQPLKHSNPNEALGFQPNMLTNHFFGRLVPKGDEFLHWQKLSQIGKISWIWNAINVKIVEQLSQLPQDQHQFIKLYELDHKCYLQFHKFIGGKTPMTEDRFEQIRNAKPGKAKKHRFPKSWTQQEQQEFLDETQTARDLLKFE